MNGRMVVFLLVLAWGTEIWSAPAQPLKCKVDEVLPNGALFFSNDPDHGPVAGDRITLDMKKLYVDDFTFESGNHVPLKEAGMKLANRSPYEEKYASLFTGTFLSPQYDYTVNLVFSHGDTTSMGTLQALQKSMYGMKLEELRMTCTHLR